MSILGFGTCILIFIDIVFYSEIALFFRFRRRDKLLEKAKRGGKDGNKDWD